MENPSLSDTEAAALWTGFSAKHPLLIPGFTGHDPFSGDGFVNRPSAFPYRG
jgi:hypothetical protein